MGISYYNLITGEYVGINDYEVFTAASTVKVPISMVVADMLYEGEISENYSVFYADNDYEGELVFCKEWICPGPITLLLCLNI